MFWALTPTQGTGPVSGMPHGDVKPTQPWPSDPTVHPPTAATAYSPLGRVTPSASALLTPSGSSHGTTQEYVKDCTAGAGDAAATPSVPSKTIIRPVTTVRLALQFGRIILVTFPPAPGLDVSSGKAWIGGPPADTGRLVPGRLRLTGPRGRPHWSVASARTSLGGSRTPSRGTVTNVPRFGQWPIAGTVTARAPARWTVGAVSARCGRGARRPGDRVAARSDARPARCGVAPSSR